MRLPTGVESLLEAGLVSRGRSSDERDGIDVRNRFIEDIPVESPRLNREAAARLLAGAFVGERAGALSVDGQHEILGRGTQLDGDVVPAGAVVGQAVDEPVLEV